MSQNFEKMMTSEQKSLSEGREKVVGYLDKMLNNADLYELVKKYQNSINLFGKPTSADKHLFFRIGTLNNNLVLWAHEEHIPKKGENGEWISFPEDGQQVDVAKSQVMPNLDLVPAGLTSADFIRRFEEDLREEMGGGTDDETGDEIGRPSKVRLPRHLYRSAFGLAYFLRA